jgi:hypothetical protein
MGPINMKTLKVTDIQIRETGIALSIVLLLAGLYTTHDYWIFFASGILIITVLVPSLLRPVTIVWFVFSKALGWVTSRIILFVIFWILVTPVGLIRKSLGKDSLRLREFKKDGNSVFVDRNHEYAASDLKYPF